MSDYLSSLMTLYYPNPVISLNLTGLPDLRRLPAKYTLYKYDIQF
jgi:hypothetical protein